MLFSSEMVVKQLLFEAEIGQGAKIRRSKHIYGNFLYESALNNL